MVFQDPILRVFISPRLLSHAIMSWRPPAASLLLFIAQDSPILASRCRSAYDAGWEHGPRGPLGGHLGGHLGGPCGIPHGHGSRLGDSVVFPRHGIWPWENWLRKEPRFSIPQSPFYAYLILLSSIISWTTKISSWDCHRNHKRPVKHHRPAEGTPGAWPYGPETWQTIANKYC